MLRRKRRLSAFVLAWALSLGWMGDPGSVQALPINAPLAQTLFPAFSLFVPRVTFSRALRLQERGEAVQDPFGRRVTAHGESVDLVYAPIHDFSLIATFPYVTKKLRFRDQEGSRVEINASGLGDMRLLGVYRFLRRDWIGGSFQASLVGGLKFPTGSDDERDERLPKLTGMPGDRLPPALQPGSGSVDFIIGLPALYSWKYFTLYADVFYKINTEANGFRFGNVLSYDLAVDYRGLSVFGKDLFLVLELNGLNEQKGSLPSSNGNLLFLSPGLQFFPAPTLLLEASVQIPILRENFGTQLVPEWGVVFGLRYLFPTAPGK